MANEVKIASGGVDDLVSSIVAEAQFVAAERSVMRNLVKMFTIPQNNGGNVLQVPIYSTPAAAAGSEAVDLTNTAVTTSKKDITLAEVGVMTTVTDLETRLRHRLGLAKTVSLGDSRITEAINSGIARAYADGVPGLTSQTLLGRTYGDLALTVNAHSAGSSEITFTTTPAYVFPGDILVIGYF